MPRSVLSELLGRHLETLTLHNVIIDSPSARMMLGGNLSHLRIQTRHRADISRRARQVLLEHRELLTELVMRRRESLLGVYPLPNSRVVCPQLVGPRARLDGAGLESLSWPAHTVLSTLAISNAHSLQDDTFLQMGRLPLSTLSLQACHVSTEALNLGLASGFTSLLSIRLVHCTNLDIDTCRIISTKHHLLRLILDLRHTPCVEQSLNYLSSSSLTHLVLLFSESLTVTTSSLLTDGFKMIKSLVLKNYKYNDFEDNKLMERCRNMNIDFKYVNVRTDIKSSYNVQVKYKCCNQ